MQRQISIVAGIALAIAFAAVLVGCGGQTETVQTQRAISHDPTGGTDGFYFLPPIAPTYPYEGVFDTSLVLRVAIHQLGSAGQRIDPATATFEMAVEGQPADEGIRASTTDSLYVVNWHTDGFNLVDHGLYRIYVRRASDNAEYGFADVQVFTSAKEAKSLVTQDTFALVDGRTLPIKFRIEQGCTPRAVAVVEVTPSPVTVLVGETVQLTAVAKDASGAVFPEPPQYFTWQVTAGSGFASVDGSGLVTGLAVGTATICATESLSGVFGEAQVQVTVPSLGRIAFFSNRDGNYEIYVMNSDGSNQTNLTNNPAVDSGASWSPDASKIAFTSNRDGNWEVYVMNSDGSNQTRLTNDPADDIASSWSPDGSKIAFISDRDGNYEVYVMNCDGTNPTNLTNNPAWDHSPSWSPDGSKIAFISTRDGNAEIYVMNSDGTNPTNLTNNPAFDGSAFGSWSPDGSKIAFYSNRDGNYEIYVMDSDGTNPTRLTTDQAGNFFPCWSPDGSKIAFFTARHGWPNYEVYVMNSDGTNQTNVTNNPAWDGHPAWSPF